MSAIASHNEKPLISVVMSVYNNIDYLDKATTSILDQTYTNFEFIIIDDGSTDGSRERLLEYAAQDNRINLILNEQNIGLTKNLNKGLQLAQGKYIARMDSDDYSFPTRFEKQVNVFEENQDVVLVGTGYYTIDNHDKRYNLTVEAKEDWEVLWINLFRPVLMHPSAMFSSTVISDNALLYREETFPAEDFDMWSRMLRFGRCKVIQEPLIEYRLHDNNISATRQEAQMQKTKEIVDNNLQFYFSGKLVLQPKTTSVLTTLLYLSTPLQPSQVYHAVTVMKLLTRHVINTENLIGSQKRTIYKLSARWLLKGLMKRPSSLFKNITRLGLFLPHLVLEIIDLLARRIVRAVK
jgi:glycosyltransferase involved in cell wall biosynthesis